jgi:hypothetical protein
MGYWGRAITGLALMLGAVAAIAFSSWRLATSTAEVYGVAIFAMVHAFLLGGWVFSTRGRLRGVKPGLPPAGGPVSNPRIGRS